MGNAAEGQSRSTCIALVVGMAGVLLTFSGCGGVTDPKSPGVAGRGAERSLVEDTQAPVLAELGFDVASVDVTNGDASIVITARITDDVAGAQSTQFILFRPSISQQFLFAHLTRIGGTALDGTYRGTLVVPRYSESGTWTIDRIELTDAVGNYQGPNAAAVAALGLPTQFEVASEPDLAAPTLVSLSITPASVDVSTAPAVVSITAHITDGLSGTMSQQYILFRSPGDGQFQGTQLQRVSGDARDGVYTGSITMPRFAEAGAWRLDRIELGDRMNNYDIMTADRVAAAGLPTDIAVTSTQDIQAPTLVSLSFTPTEVNVYSADAQVVVTARITDDLSGVANPRFILFRAPTSTQYQFAHLARISGTAMDGVYQGTMTIPRFAEGGNWRIDRIELIDEMNNYRGPNAADIEAMGFNATLVVNALPPAPSDVTPPVVTFSPSDASFTVDQMVSIVCSATDPLPGSGLASTTCANVTGPAYRLGVGEHLLSAMATDNAGNTGSGSGRFTVRVTSESLCNVVRELVTRTGVAKSLCAKLGSNGAGASTTGFINEVEAQAGKGMTQEAAAILTGLARALSSPG